MTRLLNTPIIDRNAAPVASSWSDMLTGLSKNEILSVPPDFWANAGSLTEMAANSATVAVSTRTSGFTSGYPHLRRVNKTPNFIPAGSFIELSGRIKKCAYYEARQRREP